MNIIQLEEGIEPFHHTVLSSFKVVNVNSQPKGFNFASIFVNTARESTGRMMYEESHDEVKEINQFLSDQGMNYAWWRPFNYIVLTEVALDFSPILFKLTTGLNLKEIYQFDFNAWLEQEEMTKDRWCHHIYRKAA